MSSFGETEKTMEEVVSFYFKVLSWHLLQQTEENHDKPVRTVGVVAGFNTSQSAFDVLHEEAKRKIPAVASSHYYTAELL
jgi:hypothetical protein